MAATKKAVPKDKASGPGSRSPKAKSAKSPANLLAKKASKPKAEASKVSAKKSAGRQVAPAGGFPKPGDVPWTGIHLVKSEPSVYPWSKLVSEGRTMWDGVRNYEARNKLRGMKLGDVVLFYHSNEGKEIVGIATVAGEAYRDPTSDEDWSVVDLAPVQPLVQSVPLGVIRDDEVLGTMEMMRRNRLSVTTVTTAEYTRILELAKTKVPAALLAPVARRP
jgi:predicted RNA-binding protein with PUA-like domain